MNRAKHVALPDAALKSELQRQQIVTLLAAELRVICARYDLHKLQAGPLAELDGLFDALDKHLRKMEDDDGCE